MKPTLEQVRKAEFAISTSRVSPALEGARTHLVHGMNGIYVVTLWETDQRQWHCSCPASKLCWHVVAAQRLEARSESR